VVGRKEIESLLQRPKRRVLPLHHLPEKPWKWSQPATIGPAWGVVLAVVGETSL
jgi:hypothetical protein